MTEKHRYIIDPGHGWLKVPLSEIKGLTLSRFSYCDREYAYLEEDCDMGIFMRAKGLENDDVEVVHVDQFNRSNKWSLSEREV